MDGDDFVNIVNPGTGNLSRVGWAGDDSELVDGAHGQNLLLNGAKSCNGGNGQFANFISQSFSIEVYITAINTAAGNNFLVNKYTFNASGWLLRIRIGNSIWLDTYQAAASQSTQSNVLNFDGVTNHIVCTRNGGDVRLYLNGTEVTYAVKPVHINPVDASGDDFVVYQTLDGYGGNVRVWEGRILGAADVRSLYIYGPNRT